MSYILDALKRSEAERERERGTAPGLLGQAHRVIDPAEDEVPVVPPLKAGRLVGLGLVLAAVLAGLGWWLWSPAPQPAPSLARTAPPAAPSLPPAASPPVATVMPVPPPLAADAGTALPPRPEPGQALPPTAGPADLGKASAPPTMALGPLPGGAAAVPAAAVAPGAAPQPGMRDAPGLTSPPPAVRPLPTPAPAPIAPRPQATPPAVQPPRVANGAGASEAVSPAGGPAVKPATQRLSELPVDLRRQLPPLKVSGSVYSPDAPARMLILDGQILREGQNVGPDLLLEQIGPKAAVLSLRGQRFELPYGP